MLEELMRGSYLVDPQNSIIRIMRSAVSSFENSGFPLVSRALGIEPWSKRFETLLGDATGSVIIQDGR